MGENPSGLKNPVEEMQELVVNMTVTNVKLYLESEQMLRDAVQAVVGSDPRDKKLREAVFYKLK